MIAMIMIGIHGSPRRAEAAAQPAPPGEQGIAVRSGADTGSGETDSRIDIGV